MVNKSKLHPAVAAAQAIVDAHASALKKAHSEVKRLSDLHTASLVSLREAMLEADAMLPQCRMVLIGFRSDSVRQEIGPIVILRKTPTGTLVTRRSGEPNMGELRFVWSPHRGVYTQAEKTQAWARDHRELRDVPVEFLPPTKPTP